MYCEKVILLANRTFEYWLELQKHKWQAQQKRVAAINKLKGYDLPTPDFPIEYNAEAGTIKLNEQTTEFYVNDSEEFIDFVGQLIWGEDK